MPLSPLLPGDPRRIGAYRLLERLGEGGMGSVYLGQSETGRRVAVKVVRPELSSEPEFRARFRSEVERARQVPPFCTAEILDADADAEQPYLVAELVEGPSLAEAVGEGGPLTGGSLHNVAIGVATALVAIHDAGVVHRDLKPANVLFALAAPKVIDFGIAKGVGSIDQHTEPGLVLGTIAYMGPERFDAETSRSVGPATDIFAWGAVVTYAATGHTPYSPDDMIGAAAGLPLPEPDLDGLPSPLRELVGLALLADPARRPSAHELLDRLLVAGAAGDPQVRAGLVGRPELRRAAAAVRHTVQMALPQRPGGQAAESQAPEAQPAESQAFAAQPAENPLPNAQPAESPVSNAQPAGRPVSNVQPAESPLPNAQPAGRQAVEGRRWVSGRGSSGRSACRRRVRTGVLAALVALGCGIGLSVALPGEPLREPEPSAGGLALVERTTGPASRDEERERCAFDGPVELGPARPAVAACPPAGSAGGWSATVRFALAVPDGCALIRVRSRTGAYRVTVCGDRALLEAETGRLVRMLAFRSLRPPADPAGWRHLVVRTAGSDLEVILDGRAVLSAPVAIPGVRGAVVLGMTPGAEATGEATVVTFAEVAIERV